MRTLNTRANRGFTIVELAVTLVMVAIVVTTALPSMRGLILNNRLKTETGEFLTALYFARSEAVKRKTSVTICPSTNAKDCLAGASMSDWRRGWVVRTTSEVLRAKSSIETDIAITGTVTSIVFTATGTGNLASAGSFSLCSGDVAQGRRIQITDTGRPYIGNTTCSS